MKKWFNAVPPKKKKHMQIILQEYTKGIKTIYINRLLNCNIFPEFFFNHQFPWKMTELGLTCYVAMAKLVLLFPSS